jgi:hypothetical protein
MTRFSAYLVFGIIYEVVYLGIGFILSIIISVIGIILFAELPQIFLAIISIIMLAFAVLSGYRTKMAVDLYGERDMKFWQAHKASGKLLRTQMGLLPVIGFIFKQKADE